ncbi:MULTISPECIES: hypothetical protein [Reichenbachiella]|uniref:SpoIIAA-like n=1 Tax=Reichenbachiella agariperforans TaxID=156994 RepID=A0A1M6RCH7_REIAG|nr:MULTISPECIES: hypothetical protein [Reichenbachiella]RJE70600.1 hypothetical protein BGP76_10975 [Reichenbachiella sp. MSK19-1]SHK30153.1 hypothetical protein SAMN04488028_104117 [Reichenbachiella agariperforans]
MYKIEQKDFGYYLTFSGFIKKEEMEEWYKESLALLEKAPAHFGVFADLRDMKPLPAESQSVMEEGQKNYKQKGMVRSVVVLSSSIPTMQFKRIAKTTGIYQWERYIDASNNKDWEATGINWIKDEIDPDAK